MVWTCGGEIGGVSGHRQGGLNDADKAVGEALLLLERGLALDVTVGEVCRGVLATPRMSAELSWRSGGPEQRGDSHLRVTEDEGD